jgi:uncharacterized iron-regulated protein
MTHIDHFTQRYQHLREELSSFDSLLQGTITKRTIERNVTTKTGKKKKTFGPYFQWTWKKKGKTVTVNLSPEQVPLIQQAIDNNNRLMDILEEMRTLSLKIIDETTTGVKRRKYSSILDFKG